MVLQSLGQQPSIEEVKAMINEIDKDGNGELEVNGAHCRTHRHPWLSPALVSCGLPLSFSDAPHLLPMARVWLAV